MTAFAPGDRLVVVDVETTGVATARGGRVIEIGAVAIEDGRIAGEFSSLIDSGAQISFHAYQVHGISAQMLSGQPLPHQIWPDFANFIGTAELIAHNAPFDRSYVCHELSLLGTTLTNPWHCTVRLARKRLPQLPNHKLDTVYRHLFGSLPSGVQRHRALDDARMTAQVWLKLQL